MGTVLAVVLLVLIVVLNSLPKGPVQLQKNLYTDYLDDVRKRRRKKAQGRSYRL